MTTDALTRRWVPGPRDVVAALAAVVVSLWVLWSAGSGPGYQSAPAGFVLTGVGAAALAWWRRQPMFAVALSSAATTAVAVLDHHVDVLPFIVAGLLFSAGSQLARREAILAFVLPCAAVVITALSGGRDLGRSALVQTLLIFATVWMLGRLARSRRHALLALVTATEQQAVADRDRAALAQVEERLRIARELHDILAHSISVISVQATVGEHLSAQDPTAARQSLVTIGELSRASMTEIRQMLSLLRDDTSMGEPLSYEPARGLADLADLLVTYRTTGMAVAMETSGDRRPLSESADLCGYRIVQEALTNTLKHSSARAADVRLDYGPRSWTVTVSDDGPSHRLDASSTDRPGHGLIGMHERTILLGGKLHTGPSPSGGFTVRATIPYEPA